jgi:LacI family transcriptional regulator
VPRCGISSGSDTRASGPQRLRRPDRAPEPATRCSLGVVPTLHALNRSDIALVCFGDFAMADLLQPGVTVVDHSAEAIGATAAARLAERIAHPEVAAACEAGLWFDMQDSGLVALKM